MGKDTAAAAADTAEELPRTIVRRVVKERLSEISGDGGDVNLHKEALLAFSESARIFIHYLAATAHDICTDSKRQIINADDVLNALEEIEFSEFVEPLRGALEELRKKNAGKRAAAAKTKEVDKKQKTDKEASTENGQNEDEENDKDKEDDDDKEDEDKEENEGKVDGKDKEDYKNKQEDEDKEDNDDKEDSEENGDNDEEQVSEDEDDAGDSLD